MLGHDRDATQSLRSELLRMIRRAGLTRWPRPFHNLHASRPTELADQFPLHVVTDWIGNSPDVADRHYLKTTEDHFQRAVGGNADSAVKERRPTVGAATAQNGLKGLAKRKRPTDER